MSVINIIDFRRHTVGPGGDRDPECLTTRPNSKLAQTELCNKYRIQLVVYLPPIVTKNIGGLHANTMIYFILLIRLSSRRKNVAHSLEHQLSI